MNLIRKFFLIAAVLCTFAISAGIQPSTAEAGPDPVVIFETTMGRFIVILYPKQAPVTVENFLKYVDAGFYDGTVFHRVIRMEKPRVENPKDDTTINIVQGGGYTYPLSMKNTLAPIKSESRKGLSNEKGTIAMARSTDPHSATSQFFINVEDNPVLNYSTTKQIYSQDPEKEVVNAGYCAFGKVLRGMNVVEEILKVKTVRKGDMEDVPAKPIYITKAYRAQ